MKRRSRRHVQPARPETADLKTTMPGSAQRRPPATLADAVRRTLNHKGAAGAGLLALGLVGHAPLCTAAAFAPEFELSSLLQANGGDGSTGFVLNRIDGNDYSGFSVSNAGDVNGDGIDDVIVGAIAAEGTAGKIYVVFGRSSFTSRQELESLNGSNGFVLTGIDIQDYSGVSVSSAGDVNGDGIDDLIVGADYANSQAGESYVVFGRTTAFPAALSLAALDGSNGFVLKGINAYDHSGYSVSGAGDVNGDGFDDVIVGALGADSYAGESYVVFGRNTAMTSNFPAALELSSLNGSNGFVLNGIDAGDLSGISVSAAGDVNGDGVDDVIVGAFLADPNGVNAAGESYVVFGHTTAFPAALSLSTLDGSNGFVLNGVDADDHSGRSVSAAGDVNNDGFDDLIVGARFADPNPPQNNSGESYVVFGTNQGFAASLSLSVLDGSNGFVLKGLTGGDFLGRSVSGAGDVNGDNIDDLIVGAYGADPTPGTGNQAGESYVVFGRDTAFPAALALSTLNGNNGFVLNGSNYNDYSGFSVSGAGDVNDDGFDDLIVGAFRANPDNSSDDGESYVVFGTDQGFAPALALSALDGSTGFALSHVHLPVNSGRTVSGAGDVNGDGIDDVIVGAPYADPSGYGSGESYVVFGTDQGFAAGLGLPALDGSNGFVLKGIDVDDRSGSAVSAAGDINDDGFDDLIVGAFSADPNGSRSGESYVVFGTNQGFARDLALSALDGSNGFVLNGIDAHDLSGRSVSGAGDVNGDGFDDLIIAAFRGDPNGSDSGESYVVFGGATAFASSFELSSLLPANGGDGSDGFVLNGIAAYDFSGASVSSAGDVNGDGFDDLIVGAYLADANSSNSGQSYVVFGSNTSPAALALSALDGSDGFALNGIDTEDNSGSSVSGAGDLNGDGFDDLIVGAYWANPNGTSYAGESYVVFGSNTFPAALALSTLDGSNGFVLNGIAADDHSGFSVSGAGDVNGDGFDDLIVGAYDADPNGSNSGESYVVFGTDQGFAAALELSGLNGSNGFVFNGIDSGDQLGRSVSGAGDVNGDRIDDLIVGAQTADSGNGESYVVFGRCDPTIQLTTGAWTLVSLPCDPGLANTVTDVFADDLDGVYGTDWIVYMRDEATTDYVALTSTDPLASGEGYWIKTNVAAQSVNLNGASNFGVGDIALTGMPAPDGCASSAGQCNMVGHPYHFDVCWADVRVDDGGVKKDLATADPAGICQGTGNGCIMSRIAHKWTGASYATFDGMTPGMEGTLTIWDGFFVSANKAGIKLHIPASKASGACNTAPPGSGRSPASEAKGGQAPWYIRLIAESGAMVDRSNVFGQATSSVDSYDAFDLQELDPFGNDYLTVVFPHLDWGEQAGNYASDYHSFKNSWDSERWDFEVHASNPAAEVTLSWEGPVAQMNLSMLIDRATDTVIRPRSDGSYTFRMKGQSRRQFTWVYGMRQRKVAE